MVSTKQPSGRQVSHKVAVERVVSFAQKFGEAHLTLACHAAFPLALTPDLLYRIWGNFAYEAPWTAVADVLLSPLCREVGHELYEMDIAVRNLLLEELKEDEQFGQRRLNDLADFLTDYVAQQFHSDDPDVRNLARGQRWTALAYTRPGEAARELVWALSRLNEGNKADLIRMASLVETFAGPLTEFAPLLAYTRGMANLARGNRKGAEAQIRKALGQDPRITVAGTTFPIPKWVLIGVSPYESANLITRSPYVTTGPTPDEMFFDREKILQEVVANISKRSYALTGGRRIGKTSMILRLYRTVLPAAGFQTLYHDCSVTPTNETFLSAEIRNLQAKSLSPALTTLGDLLKSPPKESQLVLLLDETDALISSEAAAGWPLFSQLRVASQVGKIQFVFSAYQAFQEAMRNPETPLFNFAQELVVGPLDPQAVEELVIRPMRQLGIELVDEAETVRRIYAFTSGHPNIVQRLCHRLIEKLVEYDVRRVAPENVDEIIREPQFRRDDYLGTYWGAATPFEKIISLLMATDEARWTLETIRHAIEARCGLQIQHDQVADALERLTNLRCILKQEGQEYTFAATAFPSVVKSTGAVEDMLELLVEEYHKLGGEDTLYGIVLEQREATPFPSVTVFKLGGPLTDDDVTYVERKGDHDALAHLKAMDCIEIVEPFRQGKTSLINHLMSHSELGVFTFAYIDMTTLDRSTRAAWYQTLCSRILRQLRFISREEWPPIAQDSIEWRDFISEVASHAMVVQRNVVIVLDDVTPVQVSGATEFFNVLRDVYNSRQIEIELKYITFLLAGAYHPHDLIADDMISPFNIAYRVHLADFAQAQVEDLVGKGTWTAKVRSSELAERIYHWTDGQPYLTQLLCSYLGPDATPADVDASIERLLREDKGFLYPMLERLRDDQILRRYVARIQAGERIKFQPYMSRFHVQLELLGLIKADGRGFCIIRNRTYRQALERVLSQPHTLLNADRCLAVVVGIDRFVDAAMLNLTVCVHDANAIRPVLENGWYFNDVRLLTDEGATRDSILNALRSLAENAWASDMLLFYYSGHGVIRSGDSYLVAHDTRLAILEETAISLAQVQKILESSRARIKLALLKLVGLFDAMRSPPGSLHYVWVKERANPYT